MEIVQPKTERMEKEGNNILTMAGAMKVTDNASFEMAANFLNEVKAIYKRILLEFEGTEDNLGPVKAAHAAWKKMVALRDRMLQPFGEAETIVKQAMSTYTWEQNEKRRKEAEEAEAKARKQAEDARLAEAQKMSDAGDKAGADAILDAPIVSVAAAPVATPEPPKVKGVSYREDYDFVISNEAMLPRKYLMPNEAAIRKVVRALGRNCDIAGVTVIPKPTISTRGGN